MMRNLLLCLLIIGFMLNAGVSAQPELDTTFNSTGKVYVFRLYARTEEMIVQPDNKVVMVSRECWDPQVANPLYRPYCVLRLNENGSLDATFADQGNFYLTGGASGWAYGIAIQNDSKLIVVGGGSGALLMTRHNSNGSLDPSFGSGGMVVTDIISGGDDYALKTAIQRDGKIVVAGNSSSQQFVARYLPNGALDSSFGNGGIVRSSFGDGAGTLSLALQSDDKIVTGGYVQSGSVTSFTLARYNSDGSPDTTWDSDGVITGPATSQAESLAIQLDGRVLALSGTTIYRFNTDGSPDTSFDGDGSRPVLNVSYPHDIMVSASGKITVIGGTSNFHYYSVSKYGTDGSPDVTFSGDGSLSFDLANSDSDATAVAMDSQGRILISGFTGAGIVGVPYQQAKFSAARLLAPPVMSVSVSGRVTDANGNGVSNVTVAAQGISTRTSPFGYYTLNNIQTNRTYAFTVRAKDGVTFAKRTILVDDQITNLNFVGEPQGSEKSKQMDGIDISVKGKL